MSADIERRMREHATYLKDHYVDGVGARFSADLDALVAHIGALEMVLKAATEFLTVQMEGVLDTDWTRHARALGDVLVAALSAHQEGSVDGKDG